MDDTLPVEWMPTQIRVEIGENAHEKRHVNQTLLWEETTGDLDTGDYIYRHSLILNNSDESQYGSGTYIDSDVEFWSRIPDVLYVTELPDVHGLTRIGDANFERRYGFGISDAHLIEASRDYDVSFTSEAGTADEDNAKVELELGYKYTDGCAARICSARTYICNYRSYWDANPWHIDPIPGETAIKGYPEFCDTFSFIYLPSFFADE